LLQCSQSTIGYNSAKKTHDCNWLLTLLRNICHKFEQTENQFVALINAKAAIFSYRQQQHQHLTEYYEAFKELIAVLESYGGQLHDPDTAAPPGLENDADYINLTPEERNTFMRDRYCAALLIQNSDNSRYGTLKSELSNDFGMTKSRTNTRLH
jgi:hypothetical protein